jgi:hypothetical protein
VTAFPEPELPAFHLLCPSTYWSRSLLGTNARHSTLGQLEENGWLFDYSSQQAGLHESDGTWYACFLAAGVHRNVLGLGHSPPLVVYVLLGYHGLSMLIELNL